MREIVPGVDRDVEKQVPQTLPLRKMREVLLTTRVKSDFREMKWYNMMLKIPVSVETLAYVRK